MFQSKDIPDSRSRSANNTSNRGGRGGADRHVGRGGSSQFSSTGMWMSLSNLQDLFCSKSPCNHVKHALIIFLFLSETGGLYGKPAYKKENGTHAYSASSSSSFSISGNHTSRRPTSYRFFLLKTLS